MGCGKLSLYDVEDVDGFVAAAIRDGGTILTESQREEMMSEGRRLMLKLARDYQPGYGGRDAAGSRFSGYAARFLRIKLRDAYHRLRSDVMVVKDTDADGNEFRRVEYLDAPISLDAKRAEHEETVERGDHSLTEGPPDGEGGIKQNLEEIDRSALLEKKVVVMRLAGLPDSEIAERLKIAPRELSTLKQIIRLRLTPALPAAA